MLLNLRKKESYSSVLNLTNNPDPTADESFADSTVSRRFTRKKNASNEHVRNLRGARPAEQSNAQEGEGVREPKASRPSAGSIKPEDLFLRFTNTPTKNKNGYTPASSDRATESTYLRSRYETETAFFQPPPERSHCQHQLKEELELKTNELMLLEDEVMRLKRDLGCKEQEYLKASIKKEKEYQAEIAHLTEELQKLRSELQERNTELRHLKKNEGTLNREVKALKYDKTMLEKQMEEIYKKRLPKQLKELMSFREASLLRQVEELRTRLEESKSDHEIELEAQIHAMKEEGSERAGYLKRLEVHSRILSRRIIEFENDLKEKEESFSKFYIAMKESNNDLKEQLKKVRKENLRLKSLQFLNATHKRRPHHMQSSSEESLSLSLSSNS